MGPMGPQMGAAMAYVPGGPGRGARACSVPWSGGRSVVCCAATVALQQSERVVQGACCGAAAARSICTIRQAHQQDRLVVKLVGSLLTHPCPAGVPPAAPHRHGPAWRHAGQHALWRSPGQLRRSWALGSGRSLRRRCRRLRRRRLRRRLRRPLWWSFGRRGRAHGGWPLWRRRTPRKSAAAQQGGRHGGPRLPPRARPARERCAAPRCMCVACCGCVASKARGTPGSTCTALLTGGTAPFRSPPSRGSASNRGSERSRPPAVACTCVPRMAARWVMRGQWSGTVRCALAEQGGRASCRGPSTVDWLSKGRGGGGATGEAPGGGREACCCSGSRRAAVPPCCIPALSSIVATPGAALNLCFFGMHCLHTFA